MINFAFQLNLPFLPLVLLPLQVADLLHTALFTFFISLDFAPQVRELRFQSSNLVLLSVPSIVLHLLSLLVQLILHFSQLPFVVLTQ